MVSGKWRFKCKSCEKIWIIGYNFYEAPMGPQKLPLDMIYPDWDRAPAPAFIGGTVGEYRGKGARVNRVEEEPEG